VVQLVEHAPPKLGSSPGRPYRNTWKQ